jgi:RNA polymerase sigma factor (sigma-70 family)
LAFSPTGRVNSGDVILWTRSLLLDEGMKRHRAEAPRTRGQPAGEAPGPIVTSVRADPMLPYLADAQSGDRDAIDRILVFLTPSLLKAVRALLGPDHADVEDRVQEVLIAVIEALPGFRGDCTLLHFAIRIAIRRTTAARRRSRRILDWVERFRLREEPLADEPMSPGDATIADRRRALLRTLLGEIPETQAETIVLRTALGHSIEEIAVITNAPVNTVRSRMRLAKEALRSRVEADPRWAELWEETK